MKPVEIAEKMQMSVTSIYAITRDPLFDSYLQGLNDRADKKSLSVREELTKLNELALKGIKKVLEDSKSDNIAPATLLSAANSVLDRNGYKAPERQEHAHVYLTGNDLLKLSERAKAVDVDYLTINED